MDYSAYLQVTTLPFFVALIAVWAIHPYIVRIAKLKNIVDNPNIRKLQKAPVPVLGGIAVFFGIFLSQPFVSMQIDCSELIILRTAMVLMLYVGTMDDILGLSAISRLLIQIGMVFMLVYLGGDYLIDNMLGLWGITELPHWFALILTLFVVIGIINATNLIDGVDGLSSGYGIMACMLFSVPFFVLGDGAMATLCTATAGALVLFFLHNVFGKKSKMFIGDGGTLVLGVILAASVGSLLCLVQKADTSLIFNERASVIPFTLAVLAIPVFDTLRVMTSRMLKRHSPFRPDKTHLHHIFIDMGFTHIATTFNILMLNIIIVVIWFIMYRMNVSASIQTIVVLSLDLLATVGIYSTIRFYRKNRPDSYARIVAFIRRSQLRRSGWFYAVQRFIDKT